MALYRLKYGTQETIIDSANLDPGELWKLKDLGQCAHFTLEREPVDKLPGMDHDALDDIARETVARGGPYLQQARKRVREREL